MPVNASCLRVRGRLLIAAMTSLYFWSMGVDGQCLDPPWLTMYIDTGHHRHSIQLRGASVRYCVSGTRYNVKV